MNKKMLIIIVAFILLLGIGFLVYWMVSGSSSDNQISITTDRPDKTASVSDSVEFTLLGAEGEDISWDFGDESGLIKGQKVKHVFSQQGQYVITATYEGEDYTDTLTANVPGGTIVEKRKIICPEVCLVGEKVKYTAEAEGATEYKWMFGATGKIDITTKDKSVEYSYTIPGKFTINLTTDVKGLSRPVTKIIVVKYPEIIDDKNKSNLPEPLSPLVVKQKIKMIAANSKDWKEDYKTIVKNCLTAQQTPVTFPYEGHQETYSLDIYLQHLRSNPNTVISDVKVKYKNGKIESLEIK